MEHFNLARNFGGVALLTLVGVCLVEFAVSAMNSVFEAATGHDGPTIDVFKYTTFMALFMCQLWLSSISNQLRSIEKLLDPKSEDQESEDKGQNTASTGVGPQNEWSPPRT